MVCTALQYIGRMCHAETMADRAHSLPENVTGPFFVDSTCIDCDTCRQLAPATFGETGESSFVKEQPLGGEDLRAAYRALVACPTGSIGADVKAGAKAAAAEFPLRVAAGIWYNGFASRKSFGGSSYFVEHREGNWMIDSPRYVEHLVRRFEEMG
jgi:ferredoxin